MARRDEIFVSKYLKASDLHGKPLTVTIEGTWTDTLKAPDGKEQVKTLVRFKGIKKHFVVNMTNWDAIADITNEGDSDDWRGHTIELFPTETEMRGKVVSCIRVRQPAQQELPKPKSKPKPSTDDDMDDSIPF